jgi:hypothetical protein
MQLSDRFPVERLPNRIQETILMEFQGRQPTVLDITQVPDTHWLALPGIGPMMLARLRSITDGISVGIPPRPRPLAKTSNSQLSERYEQVKARRDRLHTKLKKSRDELQAIRRELHRRGIVPRAD